MNKLMFSIKLLNQVCWNYFSVFTVQFVRLYWTVNFWGQNRWRSHWTLLDHYSSMQKIKALVCPPPLVFAGCRCFLMDDTTKVGVAGEGGPSHAPHREKSGCQGKDSQQPDKDCGPTQHCVLFNLWAPLTENAYA